MAFTYEALIMDLCLLTVSSEKPQCDYKKKCALEQIASAYKNVTNKLRDTKLKIFLPYQGFLRSNQLYHDFFYALVYFVFFLVYKLCMSCE